jgi:hypothetical protein
METSRLERVKKLLRGILRDPKCIQALQTPLICVLNDKFVSAAFIAFTNLHFFTRSCPKVPKVSQGFHGIPAQARHQSVGHPPALHASFIPENRLSAEFACDRNHRQDSRSGGS